MDINGDSSCEEKKSECVKAKKKKKGRPKKEEINTSEQIQKKIKNNQCNTEKIE